MKIVHLHALMTEEDLLITMILPSGMMSDLGLMKAEEAHETLMSLHCETRLL